MALVSCPFFVFASLENKYYLLVLIILVVSLNIVSSVYVAVISIMLFLDKSKLSLELKSVE